LGGVGSRAPILFAEQQSAGEVTCGSWKSLVGNLAKPGFPAMKNELRDRYSPANGDANAKARRLIGKTSHDMPNEATVMADLEINGFAIIPNIFSREALSELQKEHEKYWETFRKSSVTNRNGVGAFRGNTVLFLERGRYDLELDFGIFRSKRLLQNSRIIKITNKLLKSNYISYAGSLPSIPNSQDGSWHRDAYSLFDDEVLETTLPIFYVTVLIPLVDIDASNGATEFIVGSHKGGKSGKRIVVQATAGTAIVCNGMVYHRGRANKSHKERHMLYIVYCKKWYNDYI
jgi:ectoine hydroxylase-related dioxygenase (phytanoyl-CoA dioxygenase family)